MNNSKINPLLSNQKPLKILLEAYNKSGTSQNIERYISCKESICPTVRSYLGNELGMDEHDILWLEADVAGELMYIFELRAKKQLSCSSDDAYSFVEWMTSEPREDQFFKSLVERSFRGAFYGDMEPIDEAISVYSNQLAA